ncbi:MAG: hypothetical protein DHS20C01_31800 [marine bacterium B5-7]|nr:MAG: hypothetical protein DHS20C01_31800 [marine bacterium B5-7]
MYRHKGRQNGMVVNINETGKNRVVGHGYAISDYAIMSNMTVDHEQIVVTDQSGFAFSAAMHRAELTEGIRVSDGNASTVVPVDPDILRFITNTAMAGKYVAMSNPAVRTDVCAVSDTVVIADDSSIVDNHERFDNAAVPDLCFFRYYAAQVNGRRHISYYTTEART